MKARRLLVLFLSGCLCASQAAADYTYNFYGESRPAPVSYVETAALTGQACGAEAFSSPSDLFCTSDRVYIADTGNDRIVVLDSKFAFLYQIDTVTGAADGIDTLNKPGGLFVDESGNLYICDTENQRLLKTDGRGKVLLTLTKPQTYLLDENAQFKPSKAVVSPVGNILVVAAGIYMGLMNFNSAGEFQGFFGSNRVEITPAVIAAQFWKSIFTEEQNAASKQFLPVEYTNACIDGEGMIYAVIQHAVTSTDELKRLNATGANVLRFEEGTRQYAMNDFGDIEKRYIRGTVQDNWFVAVDADENGRVALLDSNKGHIFVYDRSGKILFIFGRKGSDAGSFMQPSDLAYFNEQYLVLDSETGQLKVFAPTAYAELLLKACGAGPDIGPAAAKDLWNEVLKHDAGNEFAYQGLGKLAMSEGRYKTACGYFKRAELRRDYSDAFRAYRKQVLAGYFYLIIPAAAALLALFIFGIRRFKRWMGYAPRRQKLRFK